MAEKNSLEKAFAHFTELDSYDLVFKVTGKYFCPDFMDNYKNIPPNMDFVLQSIGQKGYQHTELVGIRPSIFREVINNLNEPTRQEVQGVHR